MIHYKVVRCEYTLHAEDKFTWPEIRKLGITKKHIQKVVENPVALDTTEEPVQIAIGFLTGTLSLCVAHKKVGGTIRVITFWPAEKGRYERKILQG